jgi:GNAT superfamily N-acetyltransferase
MEIEYRRLSRDEVALLRQIDRSETIEKIYYHRNGQLVLENEHHDVTTEWWLSENVESILLTHTIKQFDRGGIVLEAFEGRTIAGMASLDAKIFGGKKKRLNMEILFVSKPFRRRGIARRLVELLIEAAKEKGAKQLYVSATPTENTVNFYLGIGFKVTEQVEPELFEKEPEDIHMEFDL